MASIKNTEFYFWISTIMFFIFIQEAGDWGNSDILRYIYLAAMFILLLLAVYKSVQARLEAKQSSK